MDEAQLIILLAASLLLLVPVMISLASEVQHGRRLKRMARAERNVSELLRRASK